ncbi:uncharacterized protein LOC108649502 [Drosophila navojoa]|uniref:uncharacterized protein LOC108649502 n=1 Tax=Drosophila navojoa TaxID=7232 RepID=UPI0011BF799B|nr:uncharacterized protein LOC108649502 [Drosophila navojoa]
MNSVHNAFVAAQKRRLSDCEHKQADAPQPLPQEQPEPKQRKTEQQQQPQQQQQQQQVQQQQPQKHCLLSFCNELLYEIFKYLDTASILAMMLCSPHLESFLLDHRFWHNIDLSNAPLPLGILEEVLGRATEKTHTIKIRGPPSSQHVAGEFKQFTCTLTSVFPKVATQLKVLELQGVSLDFEYIHISEFPSSLKRLKLKDCSVKVGDHVKSIFHTIEKQLIHLEDLSIEDNNWFEPYYIMALSKLPSLRRLSLKGCQMMCKFVPYGSMAARFGFQNLEVLDLRLTPINNSDLQCFSAIEGLKELLLESPPNLPQEPPCPTKTTNGNVPGTEESPVPVPDQLKMLNDDEPSTSRAAMEHLRACKIAAQSQDANAEAPKPASETYTSDNCNFRKDASDAAKPSGSTAKRSGCLSSGSDDEDTSSTSASSSDKSDNAAAHSTGHSSSDPDGNGGIQSPLVVIALPSVARHSPAPAENQQSADENPEPAAAAADAAVGAAADGGVEAPRAYIYVQNGPPVDGQRPQVMASLIEQMVDQIHTLRGNQPAHSRFLRRRDQVIYMNPQAIAEPLLVMQSRRTHRIQPRGNLEQVVQHPMFWNMLDPLDRDYSRRMRCRPPVSQLPPQCYVSDRAMYSFGRAYPVQSDVVWIRNSNRSSNNRLERIELRNYPHITNYTLEHLVQCSPNLVYIDVSGTSVTSLGLRKFKKLKPECEVVATHLSMDEQPEQGETELLVQVQPENEEQQQQQQQPPQDENLDEVAAEAGADAEAEPEPQLDAP